MADKKISQLNSASALAGTEVFPIVQSGETKKLALNAITTLGTITTGTWQGTAIADTYLATISTAGKVANSATTAVNTSTPSTIVLRDASGNFAAGTITAALNGNASTVTDGVYTTGSYSNPSWITALAGSKITGNISGNAGTATALQTARTINGVSFDGTGNITVTADAGTLTGSTLASGVTASSLTSVGTLTSLAVSGATTLGGVAYTWPVSAGTNGYVLSTNGSGTLSWVAQSGGGGGGATLTIGSFLTGGSYDGSTAVTIAADATSTNTVSKLVARDSSGNFAAGTITATLSGNASTATALQNARTINGVSFNGTADITVAAAASTLTGGTLASGVTASSLTSVGTLGSLAVSGTTALNGVTYTWPASAGTNGQVLGTNGSGTLSWINAGGGGGGGGTTTFPLTAGTYLTGGTFDGSTAVTFAVDATSANTASKVVARDANGDFAASVATVTGAQLNTTTAATANTGRIRWDATNGTPEVRLLGGNVDLDIGSSSVARVLNNTGSPLSLGQVVYITGASGQRATVALANAISEATSTDTIGFVAESIANNQEGFVRTSGIIEGINTFAFNEGDLLYLSDTVAGGFTNVRPTQPSHGVRLGYVVKKNAVDGHIYIEVNNGYELDELHDVLVTAPAAYNMLRRNAANTLWVNVAGPTGDVVGTSDSQTLTNKTISGANNTLSNIGNSSLTNSSITVNGTSIALGASGTVAAAAGTLTGTTLAANVTASSLTSVGTLTNLTVTNTITGSVSGNAGTATTATQVANALTAGTYLTSGGTFTGAAARTFAVDATEASTASKVVARNASGQIAAKAVLFDGATSGTVTVQPAATAGTWSLTLPTTAGTNGQVLTTNGSGVTSWGTASGSITVNDETTTNATRYPLFYSGTGATSTLSIDTGWTFNPSTNAMTFPGTITATLNGAAPAGSLSGSTLASGVTASSLTSVGTLTSLTLGGTVSMVDNVISRPRFTDYAETYTTPAISAGTLTLNLETGNVFRVSRNANITTLTISNPAANGNACSFTLIFDANGTSYTITWPAAVKWPGGTAPTITTTASRSDMFVFYTNNAGTTWYAMTAAQNFVTT